MLSRPLFFSIPMLLALISCQDPSTPQPTGNDGASLDTPSTKTVPIMAPEDFAEVEWTDLMPKDDFDALSNPPSYLDDIEDGSFEDQFSDQIANAMAQSSDDRYQQALVSTDTVPEMEGKAIRIPGFIVPLEFDDQQNITQFFLVPFFGACIHMPPPPPNQVIHVSSQQALSEQDLYTPFWVSGVLNTTITSNELATATYAMELQHIDVYSENE